MLVGYEYRFGPKPVGHRALEGSTISSLLGIPQLGTYSVCVFLIFHFGI